MSIKRKCTNNFEDIMHSTASKRMHSNNDSERSFENIEEMYVNDKDVSLVFETLSNINHTGFRIIITKIVNINFKSYGKEQIVGPFHKNFNAIVGPNGSGKSNVIDSVLFVFGFRASKIRSKNLSVLIHKSKQFPNLQSCSVSIHFTKIIDKEDDPDTYEEIKDSSFVITRTINKDNSSHYLLNGFRVHFKQIVSLLRNCGIDLDHNRFLILQGEVEQISLMKPKAPNEHESGMLEYLEDIIGTSRIKKSLQETDEKIEKLSQICEEKLNRTILVENEMKDLEENMLKAVHFLEVENKIIKKKSFLYQREIKLYHGQIKDYAGNSLILLDKSNKLKKELKKLTKEKMIKEEIFCRRKKEYDTLLKKKEKLNKMFNKINNRDITLQAEFQEINKRRKKLNEQIKEEKIKLENIEKIPERNKMKIEEFEVRDSQLLTQCEILQVEKEKLLTTACKENLSLQENKEKMETELIGLKNIVDETKQALSVAESQLNLILDNEKSEREKLKILKNSYGNKKEKLNKHSKLLDNVKRKLPIIENQYNQIVSDLDRVKIEEARATEEIKIQNFQIEEFRSSMQAIKSRSHVLNFLTEQRAKENLPGLFGRLGDLGAIDKIYDVAISTACGSLDNVVVDTVDTAQRSIECLKQCNIGRATFIALDKQEHLYHSANLKINIPENIPRLYDLIKVKDCRIRIAFYFALRDTLVANDINQATRIAYGPHRYRVVTLNGDLIETSGTMSGGGKSVLKGRMGQQIVEQSKLICPETFKKMEASVAKLKEKARKLNEEQVALENKVQNFRSKLRNVQKDKSKFSIEVQSIQKQLLTSDKQIKCQEEIVNNSCTTTTYVKELQEIVITTKEKYNEAFKMAEILKNDIYNVTKNMNEKINKKIKPINLQLKDHTITLEKLKTELIKLRVAIKTAERDAKKSEEKCTNMEKEKIEFEKKLHEIQKERKEIEEDAVKLMKRIEVITEELEEKKILFTEEQNVITTISKTLYKLKNEKLEIDQKIDEASKSIKESKELVAVLETKLSQLKCNEIPGQNTIELLKYTDEELSTINIKHIEFELRKEEKEVKELNPNLTVIAEYQKKKEIYKKQKIELEELNEKKTKLKKFRDDMRQKRQIDFYAGFTVISKKLKEMYQLITLGGDAELEYVDSYNPFTKGIVLNVRPPKKSWKIITNLSGGEKTLSSLALVFALHYYKPSPLYFMDEIDAALDFKNVSIIGNYIKAQTKNAQFIIVSLRPNMFELADHLAGIYKIYDITKCLITNPRKISKQGQKDSQQMHSQNHLSINNVMESNECEHNSNLLFEYELIISNNNVSTLNVT